MWNFTYFCQEIPTHEDNCLFIRYSRCDWLRSFHFPQSAWVSWDNYMWPALPRALGHPIPLSLPASGCDMVQINMFLIIFCWIFWILIAKPKRLCTDGSSFEHKLCWPDYGLMSMYDIVSWKYQNIYEVSVHVLIRSLKFALDLSWGFTMQYRTQVVSRIYILLL